MHPYDDHGILDSGCRPLHSIHPIQSSVRRRPGRHGRELPADAEVLPAVMGVGDPPSAHCHVLSCHDLDVGHPFLAGEGIHVEGTIIRVENGFRNVGSQLL